MFSNCSEECLDLIRKLLTFNPNKRITIEEALKHPYLKDFYNTEDEIEMGR